MSTLTARLMPFALALAASAALPRSATAQTFRFSAGADGWAVYDIPYTGNFQAQRFALPGLAHDPAFGNPGASIRVQDAVNETWVGAPDSIRGNRAALYAQPLSFDIYYRTADDAAYAAVGLDGPAFSLFIAEPAPALETWVHRSYTLAPGPWRVNSINGPLATEAEIRAVLADLRGLYLHTEWRTGPDDTSIDNIALGTPCGTADFNNDSDFGTDQDIEAFFACLAGHCCPTCDDADFNLDGDTGTDQDIEAFFRVLAGASC